MKDSFDQHTGHGPRPSTGSRQAGHNGGKAKSSVVRKAARNAFAACLTRSGKPMLIDAGMT
jgi:hypothetical protein